MSNLIVVAAGLFGAVFGSFSSVVIGRVPEGRSIVTPGSACPICGHGIAWYDNIPVVSYLILSGKCRNCRGKISVRYPILELISAGLWVAVTTRVGLKPELPAFLAFAATLVILSAIDFERHRLPNVILLWGGGIGFALLLLAAALEGHWMALLHSVYGAVAFGLPLFLIVIFIPRGMGGGDFKLATYIGFHLGWFGLLHVLVGALSGFLIGGVAGISLLAAGRKGRKDPVPFGPALAAGAILAVLAGRPILNAWLGV